MWDGLIGTDVFVFKGKRLQKVFNSLQATFSLLLLLKTLPSKSDLKRFKRFFFSALSPRRPAVIFNSQGLFRQAEK